MHLFSNNTFNYNINFLFLFFTFCLFMLFCCQLITDVSAPELNLKYIYKLYLYVYNNFFPKYIPFPTPKGSFINHETIL